MLSYCLTVMPVSHDLAQFKQGTEQNKVQIWVKWVAEPLENNLEYNFIFDHNIEYNFIYTLTEYTKHIIVTVEILSKPQRAYDEDHQDM